MIDQRFILENKLKNLINKRDIAIIEGNLDIITEIDFEIEKIKIEIEQL
jgi:hypothetical protein